MPAGEYSNGDVVVFQISCADEGPGTADRLYTIADALNAVAESNETNNVFGSFLN
jgi:subtilase family serine protease